MDAATLLKSTRVAVSLTQTEFAEAVGVQQPVISAIENGRRQPQVDTLCAMLEEFGFELVSLPLNGTSSAQAAREIEASLLNNSRDSALRAFIRFSNKLRSLQGIDRVVAGIATPQKIGSVEWDAAMAALVEYWLNDATLPVPHWVNDPSRFLANPSTPHLSKYDLDPDISQVPDEFARRNVLLERATLASV